MQVYCTTQPVRSHICIILFNLYNGMSVRGVAGSCSICTLLFQMRGNKKTPDGRFFNIQSHVVLCVCQMEHIAQRVDILGNGL